MSARNAIPAGNTLLIAAVAAVVLLNGCEPRVSPGVDPEEPGTVEPRVEATSNPPQFNGPVWFHDVSQQAGIDFVHDSGTSEQKPFPAANGSGIAAFDYDLDGRYDLYFATGTDFPLDPSRNLPVNRMYRALDRMQFLDVTSATRLGHNGFTAGLAVGDFNSDGFPDVYAACYGENCLFQNLGDGTFQKLAPGTGVADPGWATSAAMFDANGDGLLDIYVGNYGKWDLASNKYCGDEAKQIRTYCSPTTIEPVPDVFLVNQGDGTFVDQTAAAGLGERSGRTQGVVAADLDNDGAIDLYLGNDLHANFCFLNDGAGKFRDVSEFSGVGYDYGGAMQAGMGVDSADVDGDGLYELFVTNFRGEHNALYSNLGQGLFQDISHRCGLAQESISWVGWGTVFADFNLDGWLDLVVTNGHVDDNRHLLGQDEPYREPPLAWRNQGGDFTFLGAEAGPFFTEERVGRALVAVDLDNDGDTDLVIGHQDAAPAVLQNTRLARGHETSAFVSLRLVGTASNRDAIGSLLTLRCGDQIQTRQIKGGGSYLSAHDRRQVFAVPNDAQATLEIRWPGGHVSEALLRTPGNHYIVIEPATSDTNTEIMTQDFSL